MQSRNICFGAVALVFMSAAYPQAIPAGGVQATNIVSPPPPPAPSSQPGAAIAPARETASNPDPAVQRFNREFGHAGDGVAAPAMKIEIEGGGISMPKCAAESKEGAGC
jgi:hypothetical protein